MDNINDPCNEKITELVKLLEESNKKNTELVVVMTDLAAVCEYILETRKKK